MRQLFKIFLCILLFGIFLHLVLNTSYKQTAQEIELQNPTDVFDVTIQTPSVPGIDVQEVAANEEQPSAEQAKEDEQEAVVEETTEDVKTEDNAEDKTLTKEQLDELVSRIEIAKADTSIEYDRNDYESPVKKYKLDGKSYSRNKYAWHISKWLISEEPFKYLCPYTGLEITDMSTLDYEHIVALKYAHEHGANKWSNEKKNEFAYDMAVGVDVRNKENRQKGAKGPSEWLPPTNKSSYCYTYFTIIDKYDLSMTKSDVNVCKLEILNDLEGAVLMNEGVEEYDNEH